MKEVKKRRKNLVPKFLVNFSNSGKKKKRKLPVAELRSHQFVRRLFNNKEIRKEGVIIIIRVINYSHSLLPRSLFLLLLPLNVYIKKQVKTRIEGHEKLESRDQELNVRRRWIAEKEKRKEKKELTQETSNEKKQE